MPSYQLNKVCSSKVDFEIQDGKLKNVVFSGGCPGNLEAIAKLVEGMPVEQVTEKLAGIKCGAKDTSCSDQLVKAILKAQNN